MNKTPEDCQNAIKNLLISGKFGKNPIVFVQQLFDTCDDCSRWYEGLDTLKKKYEERLKINDSLEYKHKHKNFESHPRFMNMAESAYHYDLKSKDNRAEYVKSYYRYETILTLKKCLTWKNYFTCKLTNII